MTKKTMMIGMILQSGNDFTVYTGSSMDGVGLPIEYLP